MDRQHDLDPTTQPRCICGAPWRAGDCDARRDERVTAPFSAQTRVTKVFIVGILAVGVAALVALAVVLIDPARWMWP